jgi:hypothetical protein
MSKRTLEERGYSIPVKRRLSAGVFKKAHARSLEPNTRGNIVVAFDSGRTSEWSSEITIHEPAGFKIRTRISTQNTHQ